MRSGKRKSYVLYTAALPAYRKWSFELIQRQLGESWVAYAGQTLTDKTVKTNLPPSLFTPVSNRRLAGGRLLVQWGHWRSVLAAETAILDLNPRSITAWVLLALRKFARRRTLLWGHLDPRAGPNARTARLRAAMRDLADGCVLYTYDSARRLHAARPQMPVWVAPNALYPSAALGVRHAVARDSILYVGRLEPTKKPALLLEAFAAIASIHSDWRLIFVGEGSSRVQLERRVDELRLGDRVQFSGEVNDPDELGCLYGQAVCAVSPGYVGLALTQALGFGVLMVIAANEPHAPEVELANQESALFFERDDVKSLAATLEVASQHLSDAAREELVEGVRRRYTAEAMADGFINALRGVTSSIGDQPATNSQR